MKYSNLASADQLLSRLRLAEHLRIASINLKGAAIRVEYLLNYVRQMEQPYDVICCQDPPTNLPWRNVRPYKLWYEADSELRSEDRPRPQALGKHQNLNLKRVAFLVHEQISLCDWEARIHEGKNCKLAATLTLNNLAGSIDIHNVYNCRKMIDIDELMEHVSDKHADILIGDFNLHHPAWGGDQITAGKTDKEGTYLHEATKAFGMTLLSERGVPTYSRSGANDGSYESTIDLVFGNEAITSRIKGCRVVSDIEGFDSDHRVVETTLNVEPKRKTGHRLCWGRANKRKIFKAVGRAFAGFIKPPLYSKTEIDKYAEQIVTSVYNAMEESMPLTQPLPLPPDLMKAPGLQKFLKRGKDLLRRSATALSDAFKNKLLAESSECTKEAMKIIKKWRTTTFREFVRKRGNTSEGANFITRQAKRWIEPKRREHMPDLYDEHGQLHRSGPEKARLIRDSIWPQTDDTSAATLFPPDFDLEFQDDVCPQELKNGELSRLIGKLKAGKAPGIDNIMNGVLKAAKPVLLPYLEHLFNACLKYCYEPIIFKEATTVIVEKPNKVSYNSPRSWRPIALLPSIGKLLEGVIANRLREFQEKHKVLPETQFSAPGRCTTEAVRLLLLQVYSAIVEGRCATIMSMDMKGAYDRVVREFLLVALAKKKIPRWVVMIVLSFLSDRRTNLVLPGYTTEGTFWVNVGIPQGSPLSPILFVFFTSELLDLVDKSANPQGVRLSSSTYADDTHLLAIGPSYKKNCHALKFAFEKMQSWSEPNSVTWEPTKFAVMHFRTLRAEGAAPRCKPEIVGLKDEALKQVLNILGVVVDNKLTWNAHVAHIQQKVRKKMLTYRCVSGATWGLSLLQMRHVYLSKIRPLITYGCGAWYLPTLSKNLTKKLRSLQYQCLKQVSGAMSRTDGHYLHKELDVEPIDLHLDRVAKVFRAKLLAAEIEQKRVLQASSQAQRALLFQKLPDGHQYQVLALHDQIFLDRARIHLEGRIDIQRKDWSVLSVRTKAISALARDDATSEASARWRAWRDDRKLGLKGKNQPALLEDWGKQSLNYYRKLPRERSTLLLQCRTGVIGLKKGLFDRNSPSYVVVDYPYCDCGAVQTAEHLFCRCEKLLAARSELRYHVGHADIKKLMTSDADTAMEWAISHFGLKMFDSVKTNGPNRFFRVPKD